MRPHRISRIRGAARWLPAACAAALALASPAGAQSVPDVRDVYSVRGAPGELAPAATPGGIVGEAAAALDGAAALRYEARLAPSSLQPHGAEPEVAGTVLLARGASGAFDRFRVTIRGRTAGGATVAADVGSDGERFFAAELDGASVVVSETLADLGPAGSLAADLLLPGLAELEAGGAPERIVTFPAATTVGGESCYTAHVVDTRTAEHLYVYLSLEDALPRRVERIRFDEQGRPSEVVLEVREIEVEAAVGAGEFDPPPTPQNDQRARK
jgi:hypothetical protein